MLPVFKSLKGLIDIDVSHFVDFYSNCDYRVSVNLNPENAKMI